MAARILLGLLIAATGCVATDPSQNTFPQQPQPMYGPPGGAIDPGYGYPQPQYQQPYDPQVNAGYPQGYQDGYAAPNTEEQAADATAQGADGEQMPEPSENPQDPGYDMGSVNDAEIDSTLQPYGSWEDTDDYGQVWVPNTTVVGVDFTPYETCGSWIWSDWGWNYQCDWGWGWLPFHYGRWGWFGDHWGWQRGYDWSPAAVEWRGGGGYVGWRPLGPNVRDHRTGNFRDHRTNTMIATAHDSHWRFANEGEFGRGHIHGHLFANPAEGLRVTSAVTRPSVRGNYAPVSSASIMRNRLASNPRWSSSARTNQNVGSRPQQFGQRTYPENRPPTPTWRPQPQQGFRQQPQQQWGQRPTSTWNGSRPQQQPPSTWNRPAPAWNNNSRPTPAWNSRPAPAWNGGGSRPAPAWNGGGSRPAPSWSPPAHSSSPSWGGSRPSAPSGGSSYHSSGGGGGGGSYHSSGGGSSSHSSGGGSHSSGGGGGGHHR